MLDDEFDVTQGYATVFDDVLKQIYSGYNIAIAIFKIIAYFAIFISAIIVFISMHEIIESLKKEVSMFKIMGYSNMKATTLMLAPYIIIVIVAFAIAIPLVFFGLSFIAPILQSATGNSFFFTLSIFQ